MSGTGDQIVADARKYIGVPYRYGGTTRAGIDCSGLTQLVMRDCGISIGRVTGIQQNQGVGVAGGLGSAAAGDLIFFGAPVSGHVAIYSGGGRMIEAAHTGTLVREVAARTPSMIRRFATGGGVGNRFTEGTGGINGVPAIGAAAISAAGGALSGIDAVGGFFANLGQKSTWIRILQVLGGSALVVGGVVIVSKGVIGDVAASIIPGGQVVKAVTNAAK